MCWNSYYCLFYISSSIFTVKTPCFECILCALQQLTVYTLTPPSLSVSCCEEEVFFKTDGFTYRNTGMLQAAVHSLLNLFFFTDLLKNMPFHILSPKLKHTEIDIQQVGKKQKVKLHFWKKKLFRGNVVFSVILLHYSNYLAYNLDIYDSVSLIHPHTVYVHEQKLSATSSHNFIQKYTILKVIY